MNEQHLQLASELGSFIPGGSVKIRQCHNVVVPECSISTQEAEAAGMLQVQGHLGLDSISNRNKRITFCLEKRPMQPRLALNMLCSQG